MKHTLSIVALFAIALPTVAYGTQQSGLLGFSAQNAERELAW